MLGCVGNGSFVTGLAELNVQRIAVKQPVQLLRVGQAVAAFRDGKRIRAAAENVHTAVDPVQVDLPHGRRAIGKIARRVSFTFRVTFRGQRAGTAGAENADERKRAENPNEILHSLPPSICKRIL